MPLVAYEPCCGHQIYCLRAHMLSLLKKLIIGLVAFIAALVVLIIIWPEKAYEAQQVSAEFQAEALAFAFPDMPEDWQDHSLIAADGTALYWGQTSNIASAKATIILVTAYKSSLLIKAEEIALMTQRGYHVVGLDQRGQGRSARHRPSQPEKLFASDYKVYADDLAQLIKTLSFSDEHIVLLAGNSFGAATITRTLGEYPELAVDGALLNVPAFRPQMIPLSYGQAKFLTGLLRRLGKAEFFAPGQTVWSPYLPTMTEPTECAANPARLYYTEALYVRYPEQRVGGATVQWLSELMENGEIITAPDFGAKLSLPIEMVLASDDNWVESDYAAKACTDSFANCNLITIPNTGHCINMEHDHVLEQIYGQLDRLYERVISGEP